MSRNRINSGEEEVGGMTALLEATATVDPIQEVATLEQYPTLQRFTAALPPSQRAIIGREYEISQVQASLCRPELSNVLLIAEPGTGKTALVQACMAEDVLRLYREVDLSKMIASVKHRDEMAGLIKTLFDEAEQYSLESDRELVLFMDEFHQLVQLSPAAVEALKPVLAASGTRGIRVIAATTDDEFDQFIKPNQPLVERLRRIIVGAPDKATTIAILKGMAERYGVADQIFDDRLYQLIYEYTERYVPASSQPRKSILVLDSMVGWHRHKGSVLDKALLADVLLESVGVNVAFRVNAAKIKQQLDSKVFSQQWATSIVAKRLQLCVADLQDKTKPASSFLFTGSTGVGKSELTKQLAQLMFGDARKHLIRFDMSEYARDDSLDLFRKELTSRVWHTGHAVVLLDEIEKASPLVTRMLLQVLDDGRLSDANGRQVSFLNTYIVLTTNAGAEIFETVAQYNVDDTGSGKELMEKMKEIRRAISTTQGANRFPPELLGRIDAIVPFQPLSLTTQKTIITEKLKSFVQEVLTKHGVRVLLDPRVLDYLIEDKGDTDSNAGGARAAIARMTDEVATAVAAYVNENPKEVALQVAISSELKSENKELLKSDAKVIVTRSTAR
jgi:ATP-dependent Clp protease ATP-binding subunit ClpA